VASIRPLPPTRYTYQEYPRVVFDPETGTSRVVKSESEVPEGWLDRHPQDPRSKPLKDSHSRAGTPSDGAQALTDRSPAESRPDASVGLDRPAIIASLRERNIVFNPRAPTEALRGLLKE